MPLRRSVNRARWLDAEQYYRKALALNPMDPTIHIVYGSVLLPATGQRRAALRASQDAYRLAPAVTLAAMGVAVASTFLGQDADTLAYTQLTVDLGMPRSIPPLPFLDAAVAMNAGRYAEAAEHMNSLLAPSVLEAGGADVVRLVYAAAAGAADKHAATEALQTLRAGAAREAMARPIMVMLSTVWFTQLGALDLAYELAHAVLQELETTEYGAIHVATYWLPEMRPFRHDPRFQDFVTRLGLMEYWKNFGPPDDCDLKDGKLSCHSRLIAGDELRTSAPGHNRPLDRADWPPDSGHFASRIRARLPSHKASATMPHRLRGIGNGRGRWRREGERYYALRLH